MGINATSANQLLSADFGGNLGKDYLVFLGIFILWLIVLKIFKIYILNYLKRLSKKSKTELDDAIIIFIDRINWKFFIFASIYISSKTLELPNAVNKLLNYSLLIVLVYHGVKFLHTIVDYFAKKQIDKTLAQDKEDDTTAIIVLGKIVKISVWLIALLLILSNLGVNITSLVAGLGIGGIAIAFALQNILEDLFSSFTIYFDKPFKKGDFIIIGQDMGVVKHIGIKSTRIQTLQGQELVVSNRELTNTRINNYKRMERRRIVFAFGVEYSTSVGKLKLIDILVKNIFKKIKLTQLDRIHFKEFGPSSLNFEVVYYLDSSDYNKYMDTQEAINLAIKRQFEKRSIVMAFPTQTIYIKK